MTDEDRYSSGEKVVKTACALCVHSCGMDAIVRDGKIINVKGMEEHPYNKGQLCPRGEAALEFEYAPDRLKYPMKKTDGKWERIPWNEAINTIATTIGKIKEDHGARAVTFGLGSIGAEDIVTAAITQRFRGAFGSPNYISAESICFHSLILSRILTFGRFPLEEPQNAKCLIIWGSNIDDSNIGRARMVREAVANGAHLIVIDPKRTPLAKEGLYFQIRPGTDGALAMGMLNVIINENRYDKEFVERWTVGFDQLVERVQEYSAANVEAVTGISASDIKRIARIFSETKPACIVQGTCALDQQANGMQTMRAMAILQAITGNYEIPGSWVRCPIIRLSDLRMLPDEKPMGVEQYPLFGEIWGRTFPYGQGLSFPDIVLTGEPYPIKAFIGIGLNWALTFPESKKFVKALKELDLVVLMDVVMNETADYADIVLPAATFFEKLSLGYTYGVVDGIPYVLCRKKCVDPPGECRSEFELWRDLALRMGLENHIPWKNENELVSYLLKPSGITLAELMSNKESGCYFAEMQYKTYEGSGFVTPSGKIELYSNTLSEHGYDPLPNYSAPAKNSAYPLTLITGTRLREYTHSQMRGSPTLRKTMPEAVAEINPVTGDQYGLKDGEVGIVETHKGSIKIKMKYADDGIAKITLNEADKLNSLSLKMMREITRACDEIELSGKARVIVINGAGRAFCAGADVEDLSKIAALKPVQLESGLKAWFKLLWRIKSIELPTIAAVHGEALGGGFALAAACDMRIASDDVRAGAVFVKRGASSADMGVSWLLPRIIGAGWAAELMFTGDIIDASKGKSIGLFNHVVPRDQLMKAAMDLAAKLAAGPPLGLKFTKRALNRSIWDGLQGQLEYESVTQTLTFLSEDFQEGLKSFFEKRKAVFRGR